MKSPTLFFLSLLLFAASPFITSGQEHDNKRNRSTDARRHAEWQEIASFFVPADGYKDRAASYRSPLTFYDGRPVKKKRQWKERRSEILERWHTLMGEWPQILKHQQLEVLDTVYREGFTQHRVSFLWTPDEKTTGYLLIPAGDGGMKWPAVVTVYYEPESAIGEGAPLRDFALQLTKRGFVTLSIGTADATLAKTYALYYPDINNARVQPLSMLGYAAANAWHVLANNPHVDSTRIGVMGHSFGGKWAMFASCLYEKFACAVWSDPGIVFDSTRESINYWEPWYLGYHAPPWRKRGLITPQNPARGLYPALVEQGYDLHELHALMAPRPFLVSGGAEDPPKRWAPLSHTILVNKLLGFENRVAMTNRPAHSPSEESNEQAYRFLTYFLK